MDCVGGVEECRYSGTERQETKLEVRDDRVGDTKIIEKRMNVLF